MKKHSPGKNAYAICTASMGYGESYRARSQRKAEEAESTRIITGPLVEHNDCHAKDSGRFCSGDDPLGAKLERKGDHKEPVGSDGHTAQSRAEMANRLSKADIDKMRARAAVRNANARAHRAAIKAYRDKQTGDGTTRGEKIDAAVHHESPTRGGATAALTRLHDKQGKTVSAASSNSAAMRDMNKDLAAEIRSYVKHGAMSAKDGTKAIKTLAKAGPARDRLVHHLLPNFRQMHGSARTREANDCHSKEDGKFCSKQSGAKQGLLARAKRALKKTFAIEDHPVPRSKYDDWLADALAGRLKGGGARYGDTEA